MRERQYFFICVMLTFYLFVLPLVVVGATVFEDDFEAYSTGNLNGQGGWTTNYGTAGTIDVETLTVYEGTNAIGNATDTDEQLQKSGSDTVDGQLTFYLRQNTSNDSKDGYVMFFEDSTIRSAVGFRSGAIAYREGGGFTTLIAGYTQDTWYVVQAQWDTTSQSGKFRFRACTADSDITAESWSSWIEGYSAVSNYINRYDIYISDTDNFMYFDKFVEDVAGGDEEEYDGTEILYSIIFFGGVITFSYGFKATS